MQSSSLTALELIARLRLGRMLRYRRALALVMILELSFVAIRFYHLSATGYMLPDEAWYYESFVLDEWRPFYREVFLSIYLLFFGSIRDFSSFVVTGFLFASIWCVGAIGAFYFLLKEVNRSETVGSLLLLSLPLVPIFTLMLPFVLTETMALFFAMCGLLFTLRCAAGRSWWNAILASLFFVLAYKVREPYLLLALANLVTIVVARRRDWKAILSFLAPLLLVMPIPVRLSPAQFAQPVLTYILTLIYGQGGPLTSLSTSGVLKPTITVPYHIEWDILRAFSLGLFFGYNPLFAGVLVAALALLVLSAIRRKLGAVDWGVLWNSTMAIVGFAVSLFFVVYPAPGLIPIWTSSAIRFSHTSLPAFLAFRDVFHKIGPRRLATVVLIFLVVSSSQVQILTTALQSNLVRTEGNTNRLSFDYKAPYFRLFQVAEDSGKTLVIAWNHRGLRTFLSMLPNVTETGIPRRESDFAELISRDWDTILLYDNIITINNPDTLGIYPEYYRRIVLSTNYGGFRIERLWVDSESYGLMLIRVA